MRSTRLRRFSESGVALCIVACVLAGCSTPSATLAPEYDQLRPATIGVPRPRNGTTAPLEKYRFGGALQGLLGPHTHDVTSTLGSAVRQELHRKGYQTALELPAGTDFRRPLAESASLPAFDAVLYATVESWRAKDQRPPFEAELTYRLELYHVPSATRLFEGVFVARATGRSPAFLREGIRRSVSAALGALPDGA